MIYRPYQILRINSLGSRHNIYNTLLAIQKAPHAMTSLPCWGIFCVLGKPCVCKMIGHVTLMCVCMYLYIFMLPVYQYGVVHMYSFVLFLCVYICSYVCCVCVCVCIRVCARVCVCV